MQRPRQEPFQMLLVLCFSPSQLAACITLFIRIGAAGSPAVLHLLSFLTCVMFYWTPIMDGPVPSHLEQPERVASESEQMVTFKDPAGYGKPAVLYSAKCPRTALTGRTLCRRRECLVFGSKGFLKYPYVVEGQDLYIKPYLAIPICRFT